MKVYMKTSLLNLNHVNQHKAKMSVQVNNKFITQGHAGGVIMSRSIYQLLKLFLQCEISTIVASVILIFIILDCIGPGDCCKESSH